MKNFKALLAASALTLAVTGISHAAGDLASAGAPPLVTAQGTIVKEITFGTIDSTIDMDDLGGPTYGVGAEGFNPGDTFNQVSTAKIPFSANTHLTLQITGINDFTNAGTPGIDAAGVDTLETYIRANVATTSEDGVIAAPAVAPFAVAGDSVKAVPGPQSAGSEEVVSGEALVRSGLGSASNLPLLTFGHGVGSEVQIGAQVDRDDTNDHYGIYNASVNLVWSDLN